MVQLQYDPRMYRYVKSVKGVIDASPELITNSDDAYTRANLPAGTHTYIYIKFDYGTRLLEVWDHALGMTEDEMKQKFGVVGSYTSSDDTRGFFSRGAKDINRIGNVTFSAIKNDVFSQVTLSATDQFDVSVPSRAATSLDRTKYSIPAGKNGLHVGLALLPHIKVPQFERMSMIRQYFSMREIFAHPEKHVMVHILSETGETLFNGDLMLVLPELEPVPLLEETFHVPNWPPEAVATLKVYKRTEIADDESYWAYRMYGILVRTTHSIHQLTTFNRQIEGNPMVRYIYGTLECPYIDTLMAQFDAGEHSSNNAIPIVKHDRTGLDRDHPFVNDLFFLPAEKLKYILQDMLQKRLNSGDMLFDLSQLFQDIDYQGESLYRYMQDATTNVAQAATGRTHRILTRNEAEVIDENKDAVYNFSNFHDIEQNPQGHLRVVTNRLKINIVQNMNEPFRQYMLQNVLVMDVNADDAILAPTVRLESTEESKVDDSEELATFRIVDLGRFKDRVAGFAARAIAHIVYDQRYATFTSEELTSMNDVDKMHELHLLETLLVGPVVSLLDQDEYLRNIVSNDV